MLKEKYISEAQMKEEPKKKLVLKIKEGSITPDHFNKREVDEYLLSVVGSIEDTGMLPEDKAKLDALPTATELEDTFDTLDGRIDAIIGGNATLNLSVSPASIFANTSASVTVTATTSMQATNINIKKDGTVVQSGSNTSSVSYTETVSLSGGASIAYSAEGTINGVNKTVSNKTVKAYDKIYYGVGTENSYAEVTDYQSIRTNASGTYAFNPTSEKQYAYILEPYAMTAINLNNVKLDTGFGYNLQLISDNVTIDGARYRVYRSAANAAGENFNVVIS